MYASVYLCVYASVRMHLYVCNNAHRLSLFLHKITSNYRQNLKNWLEYMCTIKYSSGADDDEV